MGKVAIVTGGSKGIGKEIVQRFKSEAWCKAAVSFSRYGNISCDVTKQKDVKRAVAEVVERFGSVDILVNCAGIATGTDLLDMKLAEWNRIMETNVTGAFLMCKEVVPHMKDNGFGRIINIGSIAGIRRSITASVAYTCSKYAMTGLTMQLAPELAEYGITVNCLCPSQTMTEMLLENVDSEGISELSEKNPSKRLAVPADIASAAAFLASDEASYVNGIAMPITGGII